jgi:RsiG-like
MSDADLKAMIDRLTEEEQEVSYRRRLLHGRIDMLRTELVARRARGGRRRPAGEHPRRQGLTAS